MTRLTLTATPDPNDASSPEAEEPLTADAPPSTEDAAEPGVGEAVGGVRAAFMRMLDAHVTLLRAEMAVFGKEIGIIAGLALGALFIAILALILLYVGSFLFFGDLLFGSMGWGIIHGTLLAIAFIGFVVVNLAGGHVERYGLGAALGAAVVVIVALLLLSNVGNAGGETLRNWLTDNFMTEDLPFGAAWLVTLSGLVVFGVIGAIIAAVAGWRSALRGSVLVSAVVAGFALSGFIGAVWTSTRYEAPDGVLGLAITLGFLTWIIAGLVLVARAGFDPEARYANLIPRETIAAVTKTKEFLSDELDRQKDRMMGR